MVHRAAWLTALALHTAGCGPTLLDQCEVVCEHDLACGVEVECDEWAPRCEQVTSHSTCAETFDQLYACAEVDPACSDTCNAEYYDWVLCLVELAP